MVPAATTNLLLNKDHMAAGLIIIFNICIFTGILLFYYYIKDYVCGFF